VNSIVRLVGTAVAAAIPAILACAVSAGIAGEVTTVVSLAPNLTEIICALGAGEMLAGRTSACDYPPDIVTNVPIVGGFGKPSLEILLSIDPDLLLEVALEDEGAARKIDELGIVRRRVPCNTVDDIPRAILEIGRLLGRKSKARELADGLIAELKDLSRMASHSSRRPSVFVEIWHDPLMTAGKGSFVSELVSLAGGRNIGDEVMKEYFKVSSEWVLSRDPEIIVYLGPRGKKTARELTMSRAGWKSIRAVRDGRVCDRLNPDVVTRPGPRVLEGIKQLRSCIVSYR